jgi:hypothetical protein
MRNSAFWTFAALLACTYALASLAEDDAVLMDSDDERRGNRNEVRYSTPKALKRLRAPIVSPEGDCLDFDYEISAKRRASSTDLADAMEEESGHFLDCL